MDHWQVTSAPQGSPCDYLLHEGWEPFAVTVVSNFQPIIWLRRFVSDAPRPSPAT